MVHTAIIAFTIILMMLLFTSNKTEHTKTHNGTQVEEKNQTVESNENVPEPIKAESVVKEVKVIAKNEIETTIDEKNSSKDLESPKTVAVSEVSRVVEGPVKVKHDKSIKVVEAVQSVQAVKAIVVPKAPQIPNVPKVVALQKQLAKVHAMATVGEKQARVYEKETSQKIVGLKAQLSKVHGMASVGEKEARVQEEKIKHKIATLEETLSKVHSMASIGEKEARAYEEETKQEVMGLKAKLSETINSKSALETQLAKVHGMAIMGEKKAKAYEKETKKKITSLDQNLSQQIKFNGELEAKLITTQKLLNIEEKQAKVYEANLTYYKNHEKVLIERINTFPSKIDELVGISEKISQKAELEFNKLLSKNEVLEDNLTNYEQSDNEQKAQIATLMAENKKLEEELSVLHTTLEAKAKEEALSTVELRDEK